MCTIRTDPQDGVRTHPQAPSVSGCATGVATHGWFRALDANRPVTRYDRAVSGDSTEGGSMTSRHRTFRHLVLAFTLLTALGLAALPAGATTATLTVYPASASVGEAVQFEGSGFQAGASVEIWFGGWTLATTTVDGSGNFKTFGYIPTIPVDAHPMDANASAGPSDSIMYMVLAPSGFSCGGKPVGAGKLGTDGDDVIIGTPGNDVLFGRDGDDTMDGMAGSDTLCGGAGNDTMVGASGPDRMWGGGGKDFVYGNGGKDFMSGDAGEDHLIGGKRRDVLRGGNGNDTLRGGDGADSMKGGYGNDVLKGQDGNDKMYGQHGMDGLYGNSGIDTADGGPDKDECRAETKTRCES